MIEPNLYLALTRLTELQRAATKHAAQPDNLDPRRDFADLAYRAGVVMELLCRHAQAVKAEET